MLLASGAQAADTDLFANPPTPGDLPSVLFVIDTGAAFSASNAVFRCGIDGSGNVYTTNTTATDTYKTKMDGTNGGVEQCALYSVVKSLIASAATVNIGVMMFNSGQKALDPLTGNFSAPCGSSNLRGGCLVLPIVPLNNTTGPRILDWIKNWETSGNTNYNIKAPSDRGDGATMQEAWAYFNRKTGISGRDYSTIDAITGCASKYVVFVGNAYNTQASPKDSTNSVSSPRLALRGEYSTAAANADPIANSLQLETISDTRSFMCGTSTKVGTLDTSEGKGAYALNWARYMKGNGITTYSVGVTGASCDTTYVAQLDKMGTTEVGGGKYFGTTNFEELVKAFKTIIGEIQSVNSVFAAVSLPVSVNTQGSYLNQVFVGMFRPQKNFLPRWTGNLKQYKLGMLNGVLRLQDADGSSAINSLTGFVTECARAFWTPTAIDDYWKLDPSGGCLTVANADGSNSPDGNIVEKGAQAYVLRAGAPASRNVKTCSPVFASCSSLTSFATGNADISQALLNSGGSDRDTLIDWLRGGNVEDELDKGTGVFRPSVHGDVVHSRPVPVNHGTDASPSIVVYYGGNDGMLRAVNGNRTASLTFGGVTYAPGAELWSFVPPEFYGKIKRLKTNTQAIYYPGTAATDTAAKEYGVDGPITAFQGTIAGTPKTYVYATLRRGGRVVYAFDVTTPGNPSLLWKKGCPNIANDTDCSASFTQMGESWSSLKSMYSHGYGSGATPLVIYGGGYDECEDYDAGVAGGKNHNCATATTKGNRVYVVNAETGALVKAFNTARAVIADVTLVRDSSGKVLYGYTADLGGNVYRISFGSAAGDDLSSSWTITKIASLGCTTPASCTDAVANRKFMFAPSVATPDTIGSGSETYFLLLGSGDREKPIQNYVASKSVQNYFYMVKDKPNDTNWLSGEAGICGANVICQSSLFDISGSATPTETQLATKPKGWALRLDSTEQVVTSAITIFGVVTFSSHQPAVAAENSCDSNLGNTRVYNISYLDAASANKGDLRYEDVAGDGLPPSPVAGRVTLDDGTTVPFCIGCSKDSPLEGAPPLTLSTVTQPKGRLYWYKAR
ncbi:MAG TPA: pilus assembly protein PilY [Ramlibacter sp.]|nr:pilus assembly protein PilY [Ramlibacter sp.]